MARVLVEDDGPGMTDEVWACCFEPFFTTKEVGRGTGLGLSTTYAIVREHGGVVTCESVVGRGTTFVIELPAIQERPRSEPFKRSVERKTSAVVLVVDDEESVRRVLERVLRSDAHEVLTAADGEIALGVLERASVDVLLFDLDMPGLPWREVLVRARQSYPRLKIIAFTGKLLERDPELMDGLVAKPASNVALLEAIDRALDHV